MTPKIAHAFTIYAIDMPGMGWSDITPGASYTEPALRRAIVEFVTTLDIKVDGDAAATGTPEAASNATSEVDNRQNRVIRTSLKTSFGG